MVLGGETYLRRREIMDLAIAMIAAIVSPERTVSINPSISFSFSL